jgi:ribosomal protein S18 acetylase RimI-like enzyme
MNLILVDCNPIYWEYVRNLRLDPRVEDGFIQTTYISEWDQIKYMNRYSQNYRVALIDGVPCGYIGVINNDIRVCTDPEFQGKGIGKFMVNQIKNIWPDAFAKVKVTNEASLKLFQSCGYEIEFYLMAKQ